MLRWNGYRCVLGVQHIIVLVPPATTAGERCGEANGKAFRRAEEPQRRGVAGQRHIAER